MARNGRLQMEAEGHHYVFVIAVSLLFLFLPFAGLIYDILPQFRSAIPEQVTSPYLTSAAPKPRELFTAFATLTLMPCIALLLAIEAPLAFRLKLRPLVSVAAPTCSAALLFVPFVGSDFEIIGLHALDGAMTASHYRMSCIVLALVFVMALRVLPRRWEQRKPRRTTSVLCFMALFALAFIQLCAWRVIRISSIAADATSLDAVAYEISQAVAGRTVLVDYPSQYGLYPALLAPIFNIVGLSVLRVSLVFAGMQMASLSTLFAVLLMALRSRLVALVAGLALLMLTFETVLHVEKLQEYYFQYWPIRFFWPAMSVGLFTVFAQGRSVASSLSVSVVAMLGLMWNTDTGLFIGVSHAAYLVVVGLLTVIGGAGLARIDRDGFDLRKISLSLAMHLVLVVGGYALLLAALAWKAGEAVNVRWLIEYPRIFVGLGLMMLPIPSTWHAWMSICATYVLGFVVAIRSWRAGRRSLFTDLLFYTSMLGTGMLVYYSGRAHVFNLFSVCWPAVIVAAMLVDRTIRAMRGGALSSWFMPIPALGLASLLFFAGCFAYLGPSLAVSSWKQFRTRGTGEDPTVLSELDFIERNASGRDCLILSKRQGIYYLETGLRSPLRGPGVIETLLQRDVDDLSEKIATKRLSCFFLGLGPFSSPLVGPSMEKVLERYDIVGENDAHTMASLKPKAFSIGLKSGL